MATDQHSSGGDFEALATAIGMYALGEWTLGQAAERADVSRFRMRDVLTDLGFEVHLGGPRDVEAAREELRTLRNLE
jgi:predicted HTH domain antitoxin